MLRIPAELWEDESIQRSIRMGRRIYRSIVLITISILALIAVAIAYALIF